MGTVNSLPDTSTYIHWYIHLYTLIHPPIYTDTSTYIHWYIHLYTLIHTPIYTDTYTYIHWYIHLYTLIHSPIYTDTYTYIRWYIHLYTLIHPPIYTDTSTYIHWYIHLYTLDTYTYIHWYIHLYTLIHTPLRNLIIHIWSRLSIFLPTIYVTNLTINRKNCSHLYFVTFLQFSIKSSHDITFNSVIFLSVYLMKHKLNVHNYNSTQTPTKWKIDNQQIIVLVIIRI